MRLMRLLPSATANESGWVPPTSNGQRSQTERGTGCVPVSRLTPAEQSAEHVNCIRELWCRPALSQADSRLRAGLSPSMAEIVPLSWIAFGPAPIVNEKVQPLVAVADAAFFESETPIPGRARVETIIGNDSGGAAASLLGMATNPAGLAARIGLNLTGRDGLPRPAWLGHFDPAIGQQRTLGFRQANERGVVGRLAPGLGANGSGVLTDRVEKTVDRDAAFHVVGVLGVSRAAAAAFSRFAVWNCL